MVTHILKEIPSIKNEAYVAQLSWGKKKNKKNKKNKKCFENDEK